MHRSIGLTDKRTKVRVRLRGPTPISPVSPIIRCTNVAVTAPRGSTDTYTLERTETGSIMQGNTAEEHAQWSAGLPVSASCRRESSGRETHA